MTITDAKPSTDPDEDPVTTYDILETEPWRIRGAIRGEKRLTDAGVPVVWDLFLRGPNLYAWHRTDLPALTTTARPDRALRLDPTLKRGP